jgi:hypothetical protein
LKENVPLPVLAVVDTPVLKRKPGRPRKIMDTNVGPEDTPMPASILEKSSFFLATTAPNEVTTLAGSIALTIPSPHTSPPLNPTTPLAPPNPPALNIVPASEKAADTGSGTTKKTSTDEPSADTVPLPTPVVLGIPSINIPALLAVAPTTGPTLNIVTALEKAATASGTTKKPSKAVEDGPTLNSNMRSYLQLQNAEKTREYNTNLLGLRDDIKTLITDFSTLHDLKYKRVEADVFTHSLYQKKKRMTSDFSAWTSVRMKELNNGE